MKLILLIISLLFLPLVMQGQDVWTPNDSLKLKKMLEGKTEIQINKEALNELGKAFLPEKRLLNSHSAILPIEDFQMYKPDIFTGKYPKSTFKINGLNIWQDSLSMKIHLFSNKQLFINSQLDTGAPARRPCLPPASAPRTAAYTLRRGLLPRAAAFGGCFPAPAA